MTAPRHLSNAPIIEAVIDFQVESRAGATFSELEAAFKKEDFGYRHQGTISAGQFRIGLNPAGDGLPMSHSVGAERIGLRLQSENGSFIASVRTNGLGLSRLPLYKDWTELEKEARRLWALYQARWTPNKVTRVATRYINNLKLPMQHGQSFGDYIGTFTEIPPALPQTINGFLQQFTIVDESTQGAVQLALAWDGHQDNGRIPVIFDIDAFSMESFDPSAEGLWTRLKSLRDLKNRCFFGSLTDNAIKEYL